MANSAERGHTFKQNKKKLVTEAGELSLVQGRIAVAVPINGTCSVGLFLKAGTTLGAKSNRLVLLTVERRRDRVSRITKRRSIASDT